MNTEIDTSGGSVVKGDVHTAGGDFVGRDKLMTISMVRPSRSFVRILYAFIVIVLGIIGFIISYIFWLR